MIGISMRHDFGVSVMPRGVGERAWAVARSVAGGASRSIGTALNEQRIRLAVTGLSRAGKTVFITSVIQNLIALGEGRNTLPRIAARLQHQGGRTRLRRVTLLPTGVEAVPYFDFRANLAGLAAEMPKWPDQTQHIAQISLSLEIEHESTFGQRLGYKRVRLDILDYPGEWLLDLPMLDRSFAEWSAETIAALSESPRLRYAGAFLNFAKAIAATDRADGSIIHQGHVLYRNAIEACRAQLGLRYLQPGRFLCPGPSGDAPFMWFFPLPDNSEPLPANSAGSLLRDRFETYKREVRADFFDTHFRSFDRQVVLIDVLGALYAGQTAFDDTARAIDDIARGLRDGWGYWGRKRRQAGADVLQSEGSVGAFGNVRSGMWTAVAPIALVSTALAAVVAPRQIERVAFVATKADHVPSMSRTNLKYLLTALAKRASESWERNEARVSYHVAASVRSTEDGAAVRGDRTVEVVLGVRIGEEKVHPFDVGQVPAATPPPSFWTAPYFEMPVFRPPIIDASGAAGIPHLGLDEVLDAVIGDLL
jgi:predicted YcjX-like family ATPase